MTVSNDGKDIYVMTSYYERLNRGKRIDVVEAWDAEALTPKYEVAIPEKRAQALNYRNYCARAPTAACCSCRTPRRPPR